MWRVCRFLLRGLMHAGLVGLFVMAAPLPAREAVAADDDRPVVVVIRPEAVGGGGESELPGNFEPFERALLHSRAAGYLSRMNVDIGDRIKRGEPLATLLIPEMESELLHAEADLLAAQAEFKRTEAVAQLSDLTSRRLSDLQAGEPLAVTRQDVDVAAAEAHVAHAQVESAAAAVDVARAKRSHLEALMSYATIRAPFDGMVVRRFVDPGALIVSGTDGGDPLLEVVNADRLRLVLSIPDSVAPRVRVGLACRIHVDALPRHEFTGVISRIAGALAADSRTMRAEIDIDSEDGLLRPGMYATVKLQLPSDESALALPAASVRRENGTYVWTVRDGKIARAAIEIVHEDGDRVVVSAGIDPDALVVLEAAQSIEEGQAVRVEEPGRRP